MTKQRFLVNYDYGMGGAWAYLLAESEAEIADRFPELSVVREPPVWLTPEEAARLEATLTIDIDNASAPMLRQIIKARDQG